MGLMLGLLRRRREFLHFHVIRLSKSLCFYSISYLPGHRVAKERGAKGYVGPPLISKGGGHGSSAPPPATALALEEDFFSDHQTPLAERDGSTYRYGKQRGSHS